MSKINIFAALFIVFLSHSVAFASPPVFASGNWAVFKTTNLCYMESLPVRKSGTYKQRGEPYFTVVRKNKSKFDEVNLSSGFMYDPNKDVEVTIAKRKFPLFSDVEKAWTYYRNDDEGIIEQMKKGGEISVFAYSDDGSTANDVYSLNGFNNAYKKMLSLCE